MAGTGRSERSSHSTEDRDIIDLSDSIHSEGARERFSLSPTEQGYRSSSSINLLELSDIVQVDENVNRSETGTICLGNPYQLQFRDDESDVSSISSAKSEKSSGSQEGPTSAAQVSDTTHESGGNVMSPTQSPPLQTMDRVGEYESYDPFRIPSAVFERSESITPLEWSIASNESLFSIHVGNNSFSRDHVLMLSDLEKSGELTKPDELFMFNPPPAVITSRETEMKSVEYEEEEPRGYNIKDKDGLIAEDLSGRDMPPPAVSWNSSSKSRHSDRSQSSSDSFAFPIKKKSACPSCYCSNCSRASCYCLRARCYLTWPSCLCGNCSKAFCYCRNCSRKGFCCHTSNILADEEAQAASMPVDTKRTQGTAVSSESTAKKSWFHCCSCSSCYQWSCYSCSSCYKWSCNSCSSCCKWSSRYKWSCCSCPSCCTWNFCNFCSCHFLHCCHFQRCCHSRRCCQFCCCCC